MRAIVGRLVAFWRFVAWLTSKWAIRVWALIGAYDLVCSQLLPDAWLAEAPKVKTVIEMTAGWMTPTVWVVVAAILAILASVEYVFRMTAPQAASAPADAASSELIPLGDAARLAFEMVERNLLGRSARGSRRGPLAFMAEKIFYEVPVVLGKQPPSTQLLPVNEIAGQAFQFSEDGGSLLDGDSAVFTDLCVKQADFDAASTSIQQRADGSIASSSERMIPLREAVGRAIESTRESSLAGFHVGYGSDEEQLVFGYFSAMLDRKIPIYGKTPPAADWVRLGKVDLSEETLWDMKAIKPHHKPVRITDLSLMACDLEQFIGDVNAAG